MHHATWGEVVAGSWPGEQGSRRPSTSGAVVLALASVLLLSEGDLGPHERRSQPLAAPRAVRQRPASRCGRLAVDEVHDGAARALWYGPEQARRVGRAGKGLPAGPASRGAPASNGAALARRRVSVAPCPQAGPENPPRLQPSRYRPPAQRVERTNERTNGRTTNGWRPCRRDGASRAAHRRGCRGGGRRRGGHPGRVEIGPPRRSGAESFVSEITFSVSALVTGPSSHMADVGWP